MLLSADGWIQHPDFIRIDGIADKVYSRENTGTGGLACHSIVGEEPDFQDGIPNRFLSKEKNPDGTYTKNAAASCMLILRKRAKHVQMYPVTASTWTTGGREANTTTWPMEAEGGLFPKYDEALTKHQESGFLVIATAWEERMGRRLVVGQTVRAHGFIAKQFGYAATSCESGRYRNAWARLEAGERYGDMAIDEKRLMDLEGRVARTERLLAGHGRITVRVSDSNLAVVRALKGNGVNVGQDIEFEGMVTLMYLDSMGNNLYLGLGETQRRLGEIEAANLERLDPGEVPDHTHEIDFAGLVTGGVNYEEEELIG